MESKLSNMIDFWIIPSYLDLSTAIEATFPTRPKIPTVGRITPSKVILVK